jgi:IclR family acetate operon transcriptional repressor
MAEDSKRGDSAYKIRAVERVCDILDLMLEDTEGVSLVRVAEVTDLPKSSAFRYLATLEARRFVERDDDGDYRLGLAFLPFQSRQLELLTQRARPRLEQLRNKFDETVNLGMLDGNRVIYLDIVESMRSVRLAARPGDRDHIHATALGKAIASRLPEERVRDILTAEGMPQMTAATITDPDVYLAEIAQVRDRGWALDNGENEPDGRCVAVPLSASRLPLALSVSAPAGRLPMDRVEETAAVLADIATQLAEDFGGQPSESLTRRRPSDPSSRRTPGADPAEP